MTEGRILDALRGGDHAAALKQANLILAARPSDGRWWCYAASADHALGDDRSAVDAYMRGACLAGATYLDSEMLYRRAQALFGVRSYARAQSQLRVLSDRFPYSRLAASDIDLSNRVTARLAQGVSQDNLKWYWKEAREARHRSHEGLAAEYFEEYLLLSERMHLPDQERVIGCRLLLGDTYLALGAPASALDQFEHVEPSIQSGRGALFRALALLALHRNEEARTMAELAWKSVDPRIASDGEKVYSLANRPFK